MNGLVAETTREDWPCSIAAVEFALSVYPAALGRGERTTFWGDIVARHAGERIPKSRWVIVADAGLGTLARVIHARLRLNAIRKAADAYVRTRAASYR